MGSEFLSTLKEVTIFMLAGQMLLRLLPEGYEKYARVIMGVMVLAMLVGPLLSAVDADGEESFDALLQHYETEMVRIGEEVAAAGLQERDYAIQGLSDTVESQLSSVAAEWGVYVTDVSMDGEGRLTVTVTSHEETGAQRIRIDPVEVTVSGQDGTMWDDGVRDGKEETEGTEELVRAFAGVLGVEEEMLEVIWDE